MPSWKVLVTRASELPEEAQEIIKGELETLIALHTPPPTPDEMLGLMPCPTCKKGNHEGCTTSYTHPFDGKAAYCLCVTCDPGLRERTLSKRAKKTR